MPSEFEILFPISIGGRNADDMGLPPAHRHSWSDWKEIGRTGDWFHPLIVERKCKTCGATETDEH